MEKSRVTDERAKELLRRRQALVDEIKALEEAIQHAEEARRAAEEMKMRQRERYSVPATESTFVNDRNTGDTYTPSPTPIPLPFQPSSLNPAFSLHGTPSNASKGDNTESERGFHQQSSTINMNFTIFPS
jgi:hypothetical protein